MRELLWFSLALVLYAWVLYPTVIIGVSRLLYAIFPDGPTVTAPLPTVTVILPVHNGEQEIAGKFDDLYALDYPRELLDFIVISDGSTDRTEEIILKYAASDPRIGFIRGIRHGKSAAQNLAVRHAKGQLLLLTDVETRMDSQALKIMVSDLARQWYGMVTAKVVLGSPSDAIAKGQGAYWKYECAVRQAESDLDILATASGQAIVMRRELFVPMESCYGDDCVLPIDVRLQGKGVFFEPRAIVYDTMPHSIEGELKARIRMTARNFMGTTSKYQILNLLRFPGTALALNSHKLFRWLTPFFMILILLSNIVLAVRGQFLPLLIAQSAFYLLAVIGWLRPKGIPGYAFSFMLANVGFFLGMIKGLRWQRITVYTNVPASSR